MPRKLVLLFFLIISLYTVFGQDTGSSPSIIHMIERITLKNSPEDNFIDLFISIPNPQNVREYSVRLIDNRNNIVSEKTISGFPRTVFRQDINSLANGKYSALLDVTYKNGNTGSSRSKPFYIDSSAPEAFISAAKTIFTPNNDGIDDVIIITQKTSNETEWKGVIEDSDGFVIETFHWRGTADGEFRWNGYGKQGFVLKDGTYRYSLSAVDEAGNTGTSNVIEFILSTADTSVVLYANYSAFSPNNDKSQDVIIITPQLQQRNPIESFVFDIIDSRENSIFKTSGTSVLPPVFSWNGTDSTGKKIDDGKYRARLTMKYIAGNSSVSYSDYFTVDTKAPHVSLSAENNIFSPNSDGRNDTLKISQKASERLLWTGIVLNEKGEKVREWVWNGKLSDFSWDGTDAKGNISPDGKYKYEISAFDEAGNSIAKIIEPLIIDTKKISGSVTPSLAAFSVYSEQNTVDFTIDFDSKTGLKSWLFVIRNQDGKSRKTFSGKNMLPKKIIWNGLNDNKKAVSGYYTARFTAVLSRGDIINITSRPVQLDLEAPVLDIVISPVILSLDKDSAKLEVTHKGEQEPVDFTFEPMFGSFARDSFKKIIPGKEKISLEYTPGETSSGFPLPLPVKVKVSDQLGNTSSYSVKLVLDVEYEIKGRNVFISATGINSPAWRNYSVKPVDFIQERIYHLLSTANAGTCIVQLPDAWLVYSESEISFRSINSTATSRSVVRYLSGRGYKMKNFKVISKADAERLRAFF